MKIYILLTVQVIVSFLTVLTIYNFPIISTLASNPTNTDFVQPWISQVNYATFGKTLKCGDCNGYDKWIEIYNPNNQAIDLTGYKTQTGLNNSQKIQDKLIIAPHSVGYLVSNLPQNNNNLGVKATIGSIGSADNGFKVSLISPNGQTISQRSNNSLVQTSNVNTTAVYCSADSAPIASTTALKTYSSGQISMGSINQSPSQKAECKKETTILPTPTILNKPTPIITIPETQIQPSTVITKSEIITQTVADNQAKNTLVENKIEVVNNFNTETKTNLVPTNNALIPQTETQAITNLVPNPIAEKQPDPKTVQISQEIIKTEVKPEIKVESKIENQVKTQSTVQNITEQNLVKTETQNKPTEVETKTTNALPQTTIEPTPEVAQSQKIPATNPKVALPNKIKEIYLLPNFNNQVKTQIKPTIITEVNLPITEVAQILEIKSTEQAQIANTQNTIQVETQPQLNSNPIVETQAQTPKVTLESQVAQVIVNQKTEPKAQITPTQELISEQQFINQNSNLVFNQEQNGDQNTIIENNKSTQKPLTTWFQNQPNNISQISQNQLESTKNQATLTSRKLQLEPMSTNWIIFGIGLVVLSAINNINKSAKNLMITNYSKTYSKR